MSELIARLRRDLAASRKSQDKALILLLGTIIADVTNHALELGREPTDAEVVDVLRRGIKKRREAAGIYRDAGRPELSEREAAEAAALEQYLPAQVPEEELRALVRAAITGGAATVGAIMGRVMPQVKGRADGARLNAIAREELAAKR